MNTLSRLASVSALALLSFAAQADLGCNDCEYVYNSGRYLGTYWPGDRGTFGNRNIAAEIGNATEFDNHWVFDLNDNATATLTITTKPSTALAPPVFAVEIYSYVGGSRVAFSCTIDFSVLTTPILSKETTTRRWTATLALVPGTYLIRFSGGTRATGESAYTGVITFKR